MRIIFLLLFMLPLTLSAQNAYRLWHSIMNGEEMHLKGNCKVKKVYGSQSGNKEDLVLMQEQYFEEGRLARDVMYEGFTKNIMFDMRVDYSDSETGVGLNVLDSSKVTYSFTPEGKIRYYVVDRQSDIHVIYTYNDEGLLVKCKDCIAPFGDHNWCAYYQYTYNDAKEIIGTESYNLEKKKAVDTKVLYERDSLVYEEGLLVQRITLNPAGNATSVCDYSYNKKGLLEKEASKQQAPFVEPRGNIKTYEYYCNKKTKKMSEAFFIKDALIGTQVNYYDKKGRKIKQESIRPDGTRTKLFEMTYR